MPESVAFDADYFEYLPASPGLALIRLAGRWVADDERRLASVELVVEGAGRTLSLVPLPGESSSAIARPEGTPWRGAFSAPVDLVNDRSTRYALNAGEGALAELPRVVRKDLEDQGGERTETPSESHAINLEREKRLRAERRAQESAESEHAVREELAGVRNELTTVSEALERERSERRSLEQQLGEASERAEQQLAEARQREREQSEALVETERAHAETRRAVEQELRARHESEQALERARAETEIRAAELAAAQQQVGEAEREVERARKEMRPRASRRLAEMREELERATEQLQAQRREFEQQRAARETQLEQHYSARELELEQQRLAREGELHKEQAAREAELHQLRQEIQRRAGEAERAERQIESARAQAEATLKTGTESERAAQEALERHQAARAAIEAGNHAPVEESAAAAERLDWLTALVGTQLGWTSRLLVRAPLRRLPAILEDGEQVAYLATGAFRNGACLLCVTDRRLLLIGENEPELETYRFGEISAVEVGKKRFERPSLHLRTARGDALVEEITENVEEIAEYLRSGIAVGQQVPLETAGEDD